MTVFQFLQFYFLLLMAGGLFIAGFFLITRGSIIVQPDGTEKKVGKLLKGWYFFWFKISSYQKVYYKGEELQKILAQMAQFLPCKATLNEESRSFNVTCDIADKIVAIEERFDVKLLVNSRRTAQISNDVFVYKVEPVYVYSDWVRDMMAGCVTCHSSWLGTLIYWVAIFFMRSEVVSFITSWTSLPILLLLVFNVVYCMSLSWLVTAMYSRTTKM